MTYQNGAHIIKNESFDHRLADECSKAFSVSTGLDCTVSDVPGNILFERSPGCGNCGLCHAVRPIAENCIRAHHYGMIETERFGKNNDFCSLGLTCFVSLIIGEENNLVKIII